MIRRPLAAALPSMALAAVLSLGTGCSTARDGAYPSLATRPQERMGFAEPEAPPPVPLVADPALDTRIAQLRSERAAAVQAFDAAARRADRAAGRAGRAGGDAWLDAQTALGELDALRGRHDDATSALEALAAERALALQPEYPALSRAIEAARSAGRELVSRTDAIGARLAR